MAEKWFETIMMSNMDGNLKRILMKVGFWLVAAYLLLPKQFAFMNKQLFSQFKWFTIVKIVAILFIIFGYWLHDRKVF